MKTSKSSSFELVNNRPAIVEYIVAQQGWCYNGAEPSDMNWEKYKNVLLDVLESRITHCFNKFRWVAKFETDKLFFAEMEEGEGIYNWIDKNGCVQTFDPRTYEAMKALKAEAEKLKAEELHMWVSTLEIHQKMLLNICLAEYRNFTDEDIPYVNRLAHQVTL